MEDGAVNKQGDTHTAGGDERGDEQLAGELGPRPEFIFVIQPTD